MLPTTAVAKQSWTLAATVAERCTRTQLWTTEMFYKRRPTAPSSRQNAVSRNSCRCCFWDFERQIPVRFWSTRTEKQATSGRERTIRLLPTRVCCYRVRLVLLWTLILHRWKRTCWDTCFCSVLLKQDKRSEGYGTQKSRMSQQVVIC